MHLEIDKVSRDWYKVTHDTINREGRMHVMFELASVHFNQEERERRITAGLRRRELLTALDRTEGTAPAREPSVSMSAPRAMGHRVRIAER